MPDYKSKHSNIVSYKNLKEFLDSRITINSAEGKGVSIPHNSPSFKAYRLFKKIIYIVSGSISCWIVKPGKYKPKDSTIAPFKVL